MRKMFQEGLTGEFPWEIVEITSSSFGDHGDASVSLRRDERSRLVLEVTTKGTGHPHAKSFRAGTVRQPTETIEFRDWGGGTGVAKGVVFRGMNTKWGRDGHGKTVETFGLHAMEWGYRSEQTVAYAVDWVADISDAMIWPNNEKSTLRTTYEVKIGPAGDELLMHGATETGNGTKAIRLKIEGYDVVVRSAHGPSDEMIVYRPAPPREFRKRVRDGLSFLLGQPISYLGCTEYDEGWVRLREEALDAPVFKEYLRQREALTPYPLHEGRHSNLMCRDRLEAALARLVAAYDDLKFNELSWAYWFAVFAPVHMAPVHFGALIERLMRHCSDRVDGSTLSLLDDGQWDRLKTALDDWLAGEGLDASTAQILKGKASNLNQLPAGQKLGRILTALGLRTTELEIASWKHRNNSAHGSSSSGPYDAILNAKVQRILFARMIAGLTGCSDRYCDFYSFDHPTRPVAQGVPARQDAATAV